MVAIGKHHCGQAPHPEPRHSRADLECRLKAVIEGGKVAINERIDELYSEWTAGRAAKVTIGIMVVVGLVAGFTVSPWWFLLPIVSGALLVQYAFSSTSFAGALFRRMGFRYGSEIEEELIALRVLRGDFASLATVHTIEDRDAVTRMQAEGGPAALEYEEPRPDADTAVHQLVGAIRH
jgi:hypothetical protein